MEISKLLKNWNQECSFTENINLSEIDEGKITFKEKEKKY